MDRAPGRRGSSRPSLVKKIGLGAERFDWGEGDGKA
jgi:hypothetical protein